MCVCGVCVCVCVCVWCVCVWCVCVCVCVCCVCSVSRHFPTPPWVGRDLLVVNGAYRGLKAKLLSIDQEKFCVSVEIMEVRTLHVLYV